ncbi:MAG TPA: tyramine oxidase [Thermoanaerobaculia bacterium]
MNKMVAVVAFVLLAAAWGESLEARTKQKRSKESPANPVTHPLQPLIAAEHFAAYDVVRAHFAAANNLPDEPLLFPYIALREPAKAYVRSWSGTLDFPRAATVHVLHAPSNKLWIVTVDLRTSMVSRIELAPAGTQPAVTAEEYVIADELVHAYAPWQAAMRKRGVDPDDVYVDVWAPGDQELPASVVASLTHGSRTRLLRALSFLRGASVDDYDAENPQNPYVRPIEGVVVTIDMNDLRVVHMTDTLVRPVSRETGNAATRRTGLKPLKVTQPNGGGFELTGNLVRWQNWQFYPVLHPREGLVLYDVRYNDNGRLRPVAYRMSLSEIYVPYGVPDENWSWRSAFDVGEYNLGTFAQTLEPNRDVPEHAHLMTTVFGSDTGEPYLSEGTLGMYERDNGLLWTRTDPSNAERDTRGRRDLVLTWNAWIGNYIYGFDWIFGMDGSIEVKVVLTGTTLNRGSNGEDEVGAPIVGVDDFGTPVAAPNHQHFFSFRLDLDVDGTENVVAETEIRAVAVPGYKNAFDAVETVLTHEAARDANPFLSRHWEVSSATAHNAAGGHTAFAIEGGSIAVPLSAPDYAPLLRAAFASHALWVTRFREEERYAAGDFPNQGPEGDGLVAFTSPAEPLGDHGVGSDVVVWHTIGMTHVPRPEDYPVMPVESIGFRLVPHGFFDRNPALDAQELPSGRRRFRAAR